jgi:hypothetical protein
VRSPGGDWGGGIVSTLERAIAIAAEAHAGQDKGGEPYILHPLRVIFSCPVGDARIVGVLHDVMQDSDWTLDRLRAEGFSPAVLDAVESVTRREGEDYLAFIDRACGNPLGRIVKEADILDHLNPTRPVKLWEEYPSLAERYQAALTRLRSGPSVTVGEGAS